MVKSHLEIAIYLFIYFNQAQKFYFKKEVLWILVFFVLFYEHQNPRKNCLKGDGVNCYPYLVTENPFATHELKIPRTNH